MSSYATTCSRKYFPADKTSGHRSLSEIRWVVIHDTESGANTAASVARYFHSTSAQGSAHLVIDDDSCYRSLENNQVPWAAPGANVKGFHIELCARARWTRQQWLDHSDMLARAAYKTALHCQRFGLPAQYRVASGLKLGLKGITTHAQCTKAFGGSHTDPGLSFPIDWFIDKVQDYMP
jgi:hypothetical protein